MFISILQEDQMPDWLFRKPGGVLRARCGGRAGLQQSSAPGRLPQTAGVHPLQSLLGGRQDVGHQADPLLGAGQFVDVTLQLDRALLLLLEAPQSHLQAADLILQLRLSAQCGRHLTLQGVDGRSYERQETLGQSVSGRILPRVEVLHCTCQPENKM